MKRYIFFIVLFILALSLTVIWFNKNLIIKKGLIYYFQKRLGISTHIESVTAGFNTISIHGFRTHEPFAALNLAVCEVSFGLTDHNTFQIAGIDLLNGTLSINDYAKLVSKISDIKSLYKKSRENDIRAEASPLPITTKNIRIDFLDKKYPLIHGVISGSGLLNRNRLPRLKSIVIDELSIRKNDILLNGSVSAPDLSSIHLNIETLLWQKNEINDIIFDMSFDWPRKRILIQGIHNEFIHPLSKISAVIDLNPFPPKNIKFNIQQLSLATTLNFFNLDKDRAELSGMFDGDIKIDLTGPSIANIELSLSNTEGGTIIIKNESSIAFLQKYLDQESYDILIDSLRNYSYAIGNIHLRRAGSSLILDMIFESKKFGKRDLTIDFHNILGGHQ
ncbi:MAG: YdbH domain-containing protein [Candidatus Omnitrophica bacterium]|nr:YdbH domain-containing protein [Candidatus Omnitrophota bacterium]